MGSDVMIDMQRKVERKQPIRLHKAREKMIEAGEQSRRRWKGEGEENRGRAAITKETEGKEGQLNGSGSGSDAVSMLYSLRPGCGFYVERSVRMCVCCVCQWRRK